MTVKGHQFFTAPKDQNILVWRYMDFTKFVYLLEKRALFLSRADLLGDPFEGYPPRVNSKKFKADPSYQPGSLKKLRQKTYVSSWHYSPYENHAMWHVYLKTQEGVAVQTTYKKLSESFKVSDVDIHIGMVKYLDYLEEEIENVDDLNALFVHKRKSFAHESEIRVLSQLDTDEIQKRKLETATFADEITGIYVPVDLQMLITRIYTAPGAQGWFCQLVEAMTERYGVNAEVIPSALGDMPEI